MDDDELIEHMIEEAWKIAPDAKIGFHSPYITQMNHLHMHVLSGESKVSKFWDWIEFGNRLFFKNAEDFVYKEN